MEMSICTFKLSKNYCVVSAVHTEDLLLIVHQWLNNTYHDKMLSYTIYFTLFIVLYETTFKIVPKNGPHFFSFSLYLYFV